MSSKFNSLLASPLRLLEVFPDFVSEWDSALPFSGLRKAYKFKVVQEIIDATAAEE